MLCAPEDAVGCCGDAVGTLWDAVETLWGRYGDAVGAPPRLAALPNGGPRIGGAELAAPKWRRTKCRRGRIGGAEMAAHELAAGTIGGAELTAPNWRRAEMAAQKGKYGKKGGNNTNKGLLLNLLANL